MLVTYPYRNNLSAYVAGFVDVEGSGTRDGLPQCRWRTSRPYHSAGGRDKILPTDTPPARIREKTRPAGYKTPILDHFAHAGRILSRYRQVVSRIVVYPWVVGPLLVMGAVTV